MTPPVFLPMEMSDTQWELFENGHPLSHLLPNGPDSVTPRRFYKPCDPWRNLSVDWCLVPIQFVALRPKEGVDPEKAQRHIKRFITCPGVLDHVRYSGIAYLCWMWFDSVEWRVAGAEETKIVTQHS